MKARIIKLLKRIGILVGAGIVYGIWFRKTGLGIPCPIRTITGLRCPGCGISHMCLALMEGSLMNAYRANRVVFCLLPILAIEAVRLFIHYIKQGNRPLSKWDNVLMYCLIGILVIWGFVRNIPAFSYLN